jgi:hypothetical protein
VLLLRVMCVTCMLCPCCTTATGLKRNCTQINNKKNLLTTEQDAGHSVRVTPDDLATAVRILCNPRGELYIKSPPLDRIWLKRQTVGHVARMREY